MSQPLEQLEHHLRAAAQGFPYPPSPDIAAAVSQKLAATRTTQARPRQVAARRRLALVVLALALVFLAGLMSIPGVRAAVIDFLQIGAIRIMLPEASPTTNSTIDKTPSASPTQTFSSTLPSMPTPRDLIALVDLQGETTLEKAVQQAGFELLMPAYPGDLGEPDRIFIQDMSGAMVIFVWTKPDNPESAELVLYQIAPGSWAGEKGSPRLLEHTQVNGEPAVWVEGPYVMIFKNGNRDLRRLIAGHVLIWEAKGVTYRLESNLGLDEAVKIAESLQPIP